jgi:predicted DNA-binding transcriptional regulator AlpA
LEDYQELIWLLTTKQAARLLNISDRTLYNRTAPNAKNPFPVKPIRIGRSVRFDIEDLKKFIEAQKKSKVEPDDTTE